jgi:hypothetical protein
LEGRRSRVFSSRVLSWNSAGLETWSGNWKRQVPNIWVFGRLGLEKSGPSGWLGPGNLGGLGCGCVQVPNFWGVREFGLGDLGGAGGIVIGCRWGERMKVETGGDLTVGESLS